MPKLKMKTKSAVKKRFKLTANGRIKRKRAYWDQFDSFAAYDDFTRRWLFAPHSYEQEAWQQAQAASRDLHRQDPRAPDQGDDPLRIVLGPLSRS